MQQHYIWLLATVVALSVVGILLSARVLAAGTPPQPTVFPVPLNTVAREPVRSLTKTDSLLARLLNAIDADMRSIELGRWFVAALRAQLPRGGVIDCNNVLNVFDYDSIAARVPRINAVTRRETAATLRALVEETALKVCDVPTARDTTPSALAGVLTAVEESAFGASGVLLGMPGYSPRSRLPLPRV